MIVGRGYKLRFRSSQRMQIRFRSNPFGAKEAAKIVHPTKFNVLRSLIYEIHKLEREIRMKFVAKLKN